MSLTHTISFQGLVGRTYKISGSDSVSGATGSASVTVTSDGSNYATLDLTGESYSSYKVTSISLTYGTDTLSDSVESLTPTLTYTITPYYSNGNAGTAITSGATATYSIDDTSDYFNIDSSTGNITAGTATNYTEQASATVTVTLSYGSYDLTNNTATATVYREATEVAVTSVEVTSISLTYYSDSDCTEECSALSSSVTTLYPSYDFSIIVTYNSGDETTYSTSDGSLESFATSVGSYSLSFSNGAACDYASVGSDGKVTYGSGILITSSETVMPKLTVSATVGSYSDSSYEEASITVSPLIGYLQIEASSYPSDLTCTLSWTTLEMTVYNGTSTITSGTAFSVTGETTLTCYLDVSGYSSGFAFSSYSFSADGYEITATMGNDCYITADNTTTLSAILEEGASDYMTLTITAVSPTIQTLGFVNSGFTIYDTLWSELVSYTDITVTSSGVTYYIKDSDSTLLSLRATLSADDYSSATYDISSEYEEGTTYEIESTLSATSTYTYNVVVNYKSGSSQAITLGAVTYYTTLTDGNVIISESVTATTSDWTSKSFTYTSTASSTTFSFGCDPDYEDELENVYFLGSKTLSSGTSTVYITVDSSYSGTVSDSE